MTILMKLFGLAIIVAVVVAIGVFIWLFGYSGIESYNDDNYPER